MSRFNHWRKRYRRWRWPLGQLDEVKWLAAARASPVIAVANPEWRGVYSSTVNLFPAVLPVLDGLTARSARHVAELLAQTGATRVVLSGLPASYVHLVAALKRYRGIRLYLLWHGSFMQANASHEWRLLCTAKRLASEGQFCKMGFVKAGLAEAFARQGLPTAFVLNAIQAIPPGPSTPDAGGPHLGISAVNLNLWWKLPFAMLAACAEIPGATVHLVGAHRRVIEFAEQFAINARIRRGSIPQSQMPDWLRTKHLNLSVTMSECCPMVPLESLAVGVPCLIGPNSHLFEDDPYLHSRLVVSYPERYEVIAAYARQALAERDAIIAAYQRWLPDYVCRSRRSVAEFIDLPGDDAAETEATASKVAARPDPAQLHLHSPRVAGFNQPRIHTHANHY
jgi:hypothetical protein